MRISQVCFPHNRSEQFTIEQLNNASYNWKIWGALDCKVQNLLGFAICVCVDKDWDFISLAVDPQWQGNGIAQSLVRHICTHTRGSINLMVRVSNVKAIKLYEGVGFIRISQQNHAYKNPTESGIHMQRVALNH